MRIDVDVNDDVVDGRTATMEGITIMITSTHCHRPLEKTMDEEQEGGGHMQLVQASFLLAAASITFSILDPFGSPEPHPLSRCRCQ